ncbi:hypothetical protein D3C86_2101130 [compost metagenome]
MMRVRPLPCKGILDIGVHRFSISEKLPVGRNRDIIPMGHVIFRMIELIGYNIWRRKRFKFP